MCQCPTLGKISVLSCQSLCSQKPFIYDFKVVGFGIFVIYHARFILRRAFAPFLSTNSLSLPPQFIILHFLFITGKTCKDGE